MKELVDEKIKAGLEKLDQQNDLEDLIKTIHQFIDKVFSDLDKQDPSPKDQDKQIPTAQIDQ